MSKIDGNIPEKEYDVIIVGAGILGVTLSSWISAIPGIKVCLVEASDDVAMHSSSRNTGVIHRPFYMNPEKKKLFAWASQKSYSMWKEFALKFDLPWNPSGTLEIAKRENDMKRLDTFSDWAIRNGMEKGEFYQKQIHRLISGYLLMPYSVQSRIRTLLSCPELL